MALPRHIKDIARALVQQSVETGDVAAVIHDLKTVCDVFMEHPDIGARLQDPNTPLRQRQNALQDALKGQTHTHVTNALLLLQERHLLKHIQSFTDAAVSDASSIADHHDVHVTTVIPLTVEERKALEHLLLKRFGGTLTLHEHIDPKLLGGMTVRVRDWHFDASIKRSSNRLKQQLYV